MKIDIDYIKNYTAKCVVCKEPVDFKEPSLLLINHATKGEYAHKKCMTDLTGDEY